MSGKRPNRTKRQVYVARLRAINEELKKRRLEVFLDEPGPSTVPAPAPYAARPSTVTTPAPYTAGHSTVPAPAPYAAKPSTVPAPAAYRIRPNLSATLT